MGGVVGGGDGDGDDGGGGGGAFLAACSSNALSNDERNPSSSHDENVSVESPASERVGSSYDGSTVAIHFLSSICFLVCLAQCRKMVPREKENDSPGNRKRTTDIWSDSRRIRFILSALLLDRLVADFGGVGRVDRADRVLLGGVVDILTDRRRIRFIRSALLLDDDDDLLLGGGVLMFDLWSTSNEWRSSVGVRSS